MTHDEQ